MDGKGGLRWRRALHRDLRCLGRGCLRCSVPFFIRQNSLVSQVHMHEQEMTVLQVWLESNNSAKEVPFSHSAVSEPFPRTTLLVDFLTVGVESSP